ncbi:MAG: SDR family NAD(P)-dependent oxidoreductase [Alphaproteobacteria bacterium]|nr:SDR family NAD(P)-dependent oxidoreductase [Alphaproteobacteria bacterium]
MGHPEMSTFPLPDISLEGQVVIVTGGDRGLGFSMAKAMAERGARLVIASVDADGCVRAAEELSGLAITTDILDLDQCRNTVKRAVEKFGRCDVLFNNARRLMRGPGLPPQGNSLPFYETDPDIYRQTVEVNVIGTFFMARAAIEHFRQAEAGKIINVSTSRRNFSGARNSPYGVTKAAVESETLIWARDLDGMGITVNALLPGGSADADPNRPKDPNKPLLPVDIMDPLAVWLASKRSDAANGCRYVGKLWDPTLDPDAAAEGSREEPVFMEQQVSATI